MGKNNIEANSIHGQQAVRIQRVSQGGQYSTYTD